ncbi:MAG: AAA family ATPase [Magnetococcus sp. YQC-3]
MTATSHIRGLLGENVIETLYAAHREFLRTHFGATMLPLIRKAFRKPTTAAQTMGSAIDRQLLGNRLKVQQFFSVRSHIRVWRSLCACIARGEGVVVVTGDAGIGKSQMLSRLQGLLPDNWDMAMIEDAGQPQALFTQALCDAVGADIAGPHEWSMTAEEVLDAVANRVEFGRNVLLAIDEAHRLTQENLNILNSILLFAVSQARPVQILLVGRPELSHCLDLPAFQLLRNAMIASVEMTPMSRVEVWEYIRFQTQRMLGRIPRMTWPAWLEVYAASQGNPREIDLLLHKVLFANEAEGLRLLTGRMVRQGRIALDPNYHPQPGRGMTPWLAMALLVSVLGYLSGTAYFSLFPPTARGGQLASGCSGCPFPGERCGALPHPAATAAGDRGEQRTAIASGHPAQY